MRRHAIRTARRTLLALGKNIRVNFLIAGAQKAGTSALDAYLREHPQICMSRRKEIHYFDNEFLCRFGRLTYPVYHSHFKYQSRNGHRIIGEATPIYLYWHDAPKRIWHYNPNMKWILSLRNPIERAYSHWNMQREKGREPLSFWEAIHQEPERCRSALPHQHKDYSYIDRGFYSEQLRRVWRYFHKNQTLVIQSEWLKKDMQSVLDRICAFLGVERITNVRPRIVHARTYPTTMSQRERDYLCSLYRTEIQTMEQMLGWDCRAWLESSRETIPQNE